MNMPLGCLASFPSLAIEDRRKPLWSARSLGRAAAWLGLLLGGWFACSSSAQADSTNFAVNWTIPDGDTSGFLDIREITLPVHTLADIKVTLDIAPVLDGGFNGDLYVTLTHGDAFVVLLNRPGREAANSFGYDDGGFTVTFSATATGDIHSYRQVLNGDATQSVPGGPTGEWQPDGRLVDPDTVLDTSPRTTSLASFVDLDPNGEWVLFVADVSPGGVSRLVSWSLEVIQMPEPGPMTFMAMIALLLATFLKVRHRGQSS